MKLIIISTALLYLFVSCDQQQPDNSYDVSVESPFFSTNKPNVLFDDGHNNVHKSNGTYEPFVNLIENDGCEVESYDDEITASSLEGYDLLVSANARGDEDKLTSAFTEAECDAIEQWVKKGGALLLIADHYPIGNGSKRLAERFGVVMQCGEVQDTIHFEGNKEYRDELVFAKSNGLLGNHEIINGLRSGEQITKVRSFRGQSLVSPPNAVELLSLSPSSLEMLADSSWTVDGKTYTSFADPVSADEHCQGVALTFGKGKVVVLGEAAMLTAQEYKEEKFGMNTPGNDNKQFCLNVVRWLGSR
jgi:hypothetical protein